MDVSKKKNKAEEDPAGIFMGEREYAITTSRFNNICLFLSKSNCIFVGTLNVLKKYEK